MEEQSFPEQPLEYNSQREHLIIPEYGRHIQKMVEYAITVEDRELRNTLSRAIITVMGQLSPHLRDVSDFNHKLWDHLFIISNFKLDVDSPFPKPTPESLDEKPDHLKYPASDISFRHYGKNVERLVEKAIEMEDSPEKKAFIQAIANLMKRFYLTWNRDSVSDDVIFQQLRQLSDGKLETSGIQLAATAEISPRTPAQQHQGSGRKKKQKGGKMGRKQHKKY